MRSCPPAFLLVSLALAGAARAQIIDFPQQIPVGEPEVVASVTLRPVEFHYRPPEALPPVWVQAGSTVRLQLPANATIGTIEWRHNGRLLANPGSVLELRKISPGEAGAYDAVVKQGSDPVQIVKFFETISLQVGQPQLRSFLNLSARGRISSQQPELIVGFVISDQRPHISVGRRVLVRAVGPGLAPLGVGDPLAEPRVTIHRSDGTVLGPDFFLTPALVGGNPTDPSDPLRLMAQQVGAFPLPAGSKDLVRLLALPPGAYTAVVSSANGGSGTVLVEAYEVP